MTRTEIIKEIERMNRRIRPMHDFDSCGGMSTADWRHYNELQHQLRNIDSEPPGTCKTCDGNGLIILGADIIVCPAGCDAGSLLPEPEAVEAI